MDDSWDIKDAQALFKVLADKAENHRTVAIIAGAYMEDYVGRALRLRMPGLNSAEKQKLFDPSGALGTVSARIEIAKALRIIDSDTKADLITIARIRNRFAHNIHIENFDHEDVAPLCEKLRGGKDIIAGRLANPHLVIDPQPTLTNRERFYWATTVRGMALHNQIVSLEHLLREWDSRLASSEEGDFKEMLKLARSMFRTVSSGG